MGIELTAYRMRSDRSTTELCPRIQLITKMLHFILPLFVSYRTSINENLIFLDRIDKISNHHSLYIFLFIIKLKKSLFSI